MRIEKVKYEVIKFDIDDPLSKVVIAKKPVGVTSHDIVDIMRKELQTRKVGHAGTLDPFAEGDLIIASGKFTKTLNQYLDLPKIYSFKGVIGIKSLSGDNQEKVSQIDSKYLTSDFTNFKLGDIKLKIESKLSEFQKEYIQTVPLFSSVKVEGNKLRELVRKYPDFRIINTNDISSYEMLSIGKNLSIQDGDKLNKDNRQIAVFNSGNGEIKVLIPRRKCEIYEFNDMKVEESNIDEVLEFSGEVFKESLYDNLKNNSIDKPKNVLTFSGSVNVESGTYVRTLVEDVIKESIHSFVCLYSLTRRYKMDK